MFFSRGKFSQFKPVEPQADTDELSAQNERLLIYFPRNWRPGEPVETRLAPQGTCYAGWVVGLRPVGPHVTDNNSPNVGE